MSFTLPDVRIRPFNGSIRVYPGYEELLQKYEEKK